MKFVFYKKFVALFIILFAGQIFAAQNSTVAFVVGVEHYEDSDLNKLQYTAKDARDVFKQLQAITDLDPNRSRLLIAEESAPQQSKSTNPAYLIHQQKLTHSFIQTQLRKFLQSIRDNDKVIFYFGGHGTTRNNNTLLFLPSNFLTTNPVNYLRYEDLLGDIKDGIDGVANVSVVFFANMCGAGTAAGAMSLSKDPDTEFVERWLRRNTLGFGRFAFLPAAPKGQDTFERPEFKRSIFAHHLISGLSGAAANENNEVTSGSLFTYLNSKIDDNLPKHPDAFDEGIIVGYTHEQKAMSSYLLGNSLMAVSMDNDEAPINKLAEVQLSRVSKLSYDLSDLASLRLGQYFASQGDLALALPEFAKVKQESGHSSYISDTAQKYLIESHNQNAIYPTLSDYTKYLNNEGKFYSLHIHAESSHRKFASGKNWVEFFSNFTGHIDSYSQTLEIKDFSDSNSQSYLSTMITKIDEWKAGIDQESGEKFPHLLLAYTGVAGEKDGQLYPINLAGFEKIAQHWPGFVGIIYTGPFSGLLLNHKISSKKNDVALYIAGTEANAMSFFNPGGGIGTNELMMMGMSEGINDFSSWGIFHTYKDTYSSEINAANWVVGKPVWIPNWSNNQLNVSVTLQKKAKQEIDPLRRWHLLLTQGSCLDKSLHDCQNHLAEDMELEGNRQDSQLFDNKELFVSLKQAAEYDVSAQSSSAKEKYLEFLQQLEGIKHETPTENQVLDNASESVKLQLDKFKNQIKVRLAGVSGKIDRRIILLGIATEDYFSDFVVNLNHAKQDIQILANELKKKFGSALDIKPLLINPSDSQTVRNYISENIKEASDNDLVIFIYSGRGYQNGNRRYITASNALSESVYDQLPELVKSKYNKGQGLIDISEIADLTAGKWLLALYDTQFVPSIFEANRIDSMFDKHLDSVRPLVPKFQSEPDEVKSFVSSQLADITTNNESNLRLLSSEGIPSQQVHIFLDERLTETAIPIESCSLSSDYTKTPYSPFSVALIRALNEFKATTYRKFAEQLALDSCLITDRSASQVVVQGDLDIPVFATGSAAESIVHFLSDQERIGLNLNASFEIAKLTEAISQEDLDRLTRAALQIMLVKYHDNLPRRLREQDKQSRGLSLKEALTTLEEINNEELTEIYPDLNGTILDLQTQIYRLNGQHETARNLLLNSMPNVIANNPELLKRLVVLTEQALSRKRVDVIKETEEFIDSIDMNLNILGRSERHRWQQLLKSTLQSLQEPYRIQVSR